MRMAITVGVATVLFSTLCAALTAQDVLTDPEANDEPVALPSAVRISTSLDMNVENNLRLSIKGLLDSESVIGSSTFKVEGRFRIDAPPGVAAIPANQQVRVTIRVLQFFDMDTGAAIPISTADPSKLLSSGGASKPVAGQMVKTFDSPKPFPITPTTGGANPDGEYILEETKKGGGKRDVIALLDKIGGVKLQILTETIDTTVPAVIESSTTIAFVNQFLATKSGGAPGTAVGFSGQNQADTTPTNAADFDVTFPDAPLTLSLSGKNDTVDTDNNRILVARQITTTLQNSIVNAHPDMIVSKVRYKIEVWAFEAANPDKLRIIIFTTEGGRVGSTGASPNPILMRVSIADPAQPDSTKQVNRLKGIARVRGIAGITNANPPPAVLFRQVDKTTAVLGPVAEDPPE